MKLGSHMTDEQRTRLSVGHMGKPSPKKGISMTDGQKAKMSVAHMGYMTPEKVRAKISEALIGNTNAIGCHHSEAMRARQSAARMGHIISEETQAKISATKMGHVSSQKVREMLSAMNRKRTGPLSPRWKGGITSIGHAIRTSDEYMKWRTSVFERDNYICQDCGAHNGMGHTVELEAHHIHEFAQYPDERFVVENGKTLCLECHNKTKLGRLRKVRVAV